MIVRDLIPLCADGVSSAESTELVLSHIAECRECERIYRSTCEDENVSVLKDEAEGVIAREKKRARKKSLAAGTAIGAVLLIPILVCLIVNLASGKALSWFFIVLASLAVAASLSIVPLVALNEKFLWTLLSFTASLTALLLVCCIYTHGDWFFVVELPVLFGLSLFLLPFAAKTDAAKKAFFGFRALAVMSVDTLLLFAMLLCIGLYVKSAEYFRIAFPIAIAASAAAWIIFVIARYLKISRLAKAGIFTALSGAAFYFAESAVGAAINSHVPLPVPDFTFSESGIDANIKCAVLAVCVISGLVMFIFGIVKGKREK